MAYHASQVNSNEFNSVQFSGRSASVRYATCFKLKQPIRTVLEVCDSVANLAPQLTVSKQFEMTPSAIRTDCNQRRLKTQTSSIVSLSIGFCVNLGHSTLKLTLTFTFQRWQLTVHHGASDIKLRGALQVTLVCMWLEQLLLVTIGISTWWFANGFLAWLSIRISLAEFCREKWVGHQSRKLQSAELFLRLFDFARVIDLQFAWLNLLMWFYTSNLRMFHLNFT